jgi:hypothetical protein
VARSSNVDSKASLRILHVSAAEPTHCEGIDRWTRRQNRPAPLSRRIPRAKSLSTLNDGFVCRQTQSVLDTERLMQVSPSVASLSARTSGEAQRPILEIGAPRESHLATKGCLFDF